MRKKILINIGILTLICASLYCLNRGCELLDVGGRGYNPTNSHDFKILSGIAEDSRPLRDALESYRHDHGRYPASVANLFPIYLAHSTNQADVTTDWNGWDGSEMDSNRYTLEYNVSFDDALSYEHQANGTDQWYYCTYGQGYDLTQKFAHK